MGAGVPVCMLTSGHDAFDPRIFHKQSKSLVEAGYQVSLVAQHRQNEVVDGVRIVALPKPRNRLMRMLGGWRLFSLAYEQKADVYHFHEPELLPVGLLLRLVTKAKVVYDAHEDYTATIQEKYWVPSALRKPLSRAFNLVERCLSSRLDCVIVCVDGLVPRFQAKRVVSVSNYPPLGSAHHDRVNAVEKPRLVYAGALTQQRGITQIVQSMEYLDSPLDIRLMLCGKFDPPAYEDEVKKLKGFVKVDYLGWVRPEEMPSKLAQATVGLACLHPVPNFIHMPTTKVFEYMAAGLPVVVSNMPRWSEFVEGCGCGMAVDPLNPREIARAVEYLVQNPDEAARMGENGRNAVREKYNWQCESKKLLALYEDLLKGDASSQ